MSKFIKPAYCHFQDLLIGKPEEVCNGYHGVHDDVPYSLNYSELKGVLFHFPEKSPDCLIVIEPLDKGEDVVLQGHDGRVCDLLCKVLRLTLPHSKQPLALLENDFLGPPLGVNPVCLEEVYPGVRGDEYAPCTVLGAHLYPGPKLGVDMVHQLPPVDAGITEEVIEHVLLATLEAALSFIYLWWL